MQAFRKVTIELQVPEDKDDSEILERIQELAQEFAEESDEDLAETLADWISGEVSVFSTEVSPE